MTTCLGRPSDPRDLVENTQEDIDPASAGIIEEALVACRAPLWQLERAASETLTLSHSCGERVAAA
jgi:hypothetical protein